ncbi:MAG TPA: universal stress protein [Woeseiaceae bacterium]|nr:universal stress protein [Woeseiaceae bacterium]
MDTSITRILAVIDPVRAEQWALQKAIMMAKGRSDARVLAYLCSNTTAKCDDPEQYHAVEIHRNQLWLDELLAQTDSHGVVIEPQVEWRADWRDAICAAAHDFGAEVVVKRASGRPSSLASSDRHLIRTLKNCALFLVKHDPVAEIQKVLVAVDFNARDASHTALNTAIMELGKRVRGDSGNIELHCISAYSQSDRFVHPPDVSKILGIERARAHVQRGSAAEVIPETANRIGADLVIVGNVGRRGLSGITVGNTAEKILTDVAADILVLVQVEARERNAA